MLPYRKIIPVLAGSAAYYVDSVNGNDANSGRSASQPLASFAPLTAMGTLPSSTGILVARGSVLQSMLSVFGNGIVVDAYGSGAIPLVDAADYFVVNSGWTKTAGRTNVYERTITLPNNVKAKGNVFSGDSFLTQVTSVALCDATAGTAYVSDWTAASATLYINAFGSSNPNTNNVVYGYTRRLHSIRLDGTGGVVRNMRTRRNAHQDGSLWSAANALWEDCIVEDGCRHGALAAAGLLAKRCTFYRARNDLEPPTANLLVVNEVTITGKSYRLENCIFDAGGEAGNTGISNHGGSGTDRFGLVEHVDCTYRGLTQCASVVSTNMKIVRPIFDNVQQCAYLNSSSTVEIYGATGTINQMIKGDTGVVSASAYTHDNHCTVPLIPTTGFYNFEDPTVGNGNTLTTEDEITLVQGFAGTGDLYRVASGTVVRNRCNIGPNLSAPFNRIDRLGFSGGTASLSGGNNSFPYGVPFLIGGTTYSLPQLKTTLSLELTSNSLGDGGTGSNAGQIFFTDNFNRADENLEASANWTRSGGAAAQAAVRSNELAFIGTTQTGYLCPDIAQTDFFVEGTIRQIPGTPASFPLLARFVDTSNFLGMRWSPTQFQAFRCVAGAFNGFATVTQTPNLGDVVRFVVKGTVATCYVNEIAIFTNVSYTASGLNASTRAGVLPRATALNPAIDSFVHGYA